MFRVRVQEGMGGGVLELWERTASADYWIAGSSRRPSASNPTRPLFFGFTGKQVTLPGFPIAATALQLTAGSADCAIQQHKNAPVGAVRDGEV